MTAFSDAALAVPPLPSAVAAPALPSSKSGSQPGALPASNSGPKLGPDADTRDAQISALFTAMGRASQLSQQDIAVRLQTTAEVIEALEDGDLDVLPEWEELSAVVERYAAFMNIDERPILRRLREQLTEHYLSVMSRHKTATGGASPMPMSDVSLKAFASGMSAELPPLNTSVSSFSDPERQGDQRREAGVAGPNGASAFESQLSALKTPLAGPMPGSGQLRDLPLNAEDRRVEDRRSLSGGDAFGLEARLKQQELLNQRDRQPPAFGAQGTATKSGDANAKLAAPSARPETRLDRRPDALLQGLPPQRTHQPRDGAALRQGQGQGKGQTGYNSGRSIERQHYEQPAVTPKMHKTRSGLPLPVKIAANVAFVVILMVAFINWQPNRFWSGVDQLPKPIANSIYQIFELVMPDPLAMTYRMNWVHVEDPRMRKADQLTVPQVKRLPAIDFSRIGILPK